MPYEQYLVRLIHGQSRRACPGERLWTATQLVHPGTVRFLRLRNRQGYDVYFQPYAWAQNSGYILLDLDVADQAVLPTMHAHGHQPCVLLETSPGHRQAWIHVSLAPLPPALATAIARQLARTYGGDLASSDAFHLGRLAGFTNQKPQRQQPNGFQPWVRVLAARPCVASRAASLLEQAERQITITTTAAPASEPDPAALRWVDSSATPNAATASRIFQAWLGHLRIPERFPQTDWSIADKWIAKELLRRHTPAATVAAILEQGSPGFPRRHADPQDYLRRTIARALREIAGVPFPVPHPRCVDGVPGGQQPCQC
jgi:hypothetical protein